MPSLYRLLKPLIFRINPELAHKLSLMALKITPKTKPSKNLSYSNLNTNVFGLNFANPLGLAAGYDKDGEVPSALSAMGFGFVEVGTLTPKPQTGNEKPRLFRLVEDAAVINRMGFNNGGQQAAIKRLKKSKKNIHTVLGINIGANKTTEDKTQDYAEGVLNMSPLADYLVINISSPNTPGLRDLQAGDHLQTLLEAVNKARNSQTHKPPVLVKVAPDLSEDDIATISKTILAMGVDGLIVSNTTLARPASLRSDKCGETGGLSGAPLFGPSTEVLKKFYRHLAGQVPIVGVGGIASADDAYEKIRAGATLIQLYSALVYGGPDLVGEILEGLSRHIEDDGFNSINDAVGVDVEKPIVTGQK
ncbi:MAG: quinone-dependent dihydroorotate dehydrogenase [Sphingomonadales bacterium]|nr:quinone-dependent dihydroorotate dehydrogenase [Sphingomonadales bacterium]